MDLDDLRLRLNNLGVDVGGSPRLQTEGGSPKGRPRTAHAVESHGNVLEVLERCHRVEAALGADDACTSGKAEAPREVGWKGEGRGRKERKSVKFAQGQRNPGLRTGQRLGLRCKNINTPLGSVLAQYKEAEEHWAREKAGIRREAFSHRKRAHQLELENKKLAAVNHHKSLDIKALKSALSSRDAQLQALQRKATELESVLAGSHEKSAQNIAELCCERDELRALLTATLRRLEAVDEFVYRTAASSSVMEERLHAIEAERVKALDLASKTQGLEKELTGTRKQLHVQKEMLQKMSEIQLKKNRKQQKAIRDMLMSTGPARNPMAIATAEASEPGCDDEARDLFLTPKSYGRDGLPKSITSILESS